LPVGVNRVVCQIRIATVRENFLFLCCTIYVIIGSSCDSNRVGIACIYAIENDDVSRVVAHDIPIFVGTTVATVPAMSHCFCQAVIRTGIAAAVQYFTGYVVGFVPYYIVLVVLEQPRYGWLSGESFKVHVPIVRQYVSTTQVGGLQF